MITLEDLLSLEQEVPVYDPADLRRAADYAEGTLKPEKPLIVAAFIMGAHVQHRAELFGRAPAGTQTWVETLYARTRDAEENAAQFRAEAATAEGMAESGDNAAPSSE